MKIIHSLFISIFAVLLIASCDSSTSPDNQEGQRIGTWMVYDAEAEWVGTGKMVQQKIKPATVNSESDTLYFDNPDGNAVMMTHNSSQDDFSLVYIDSTYNGTSDISTWLNNPFMEDGTYISTGMRDDHLELMTSIKNVTCDSSYTKKEDLNFIFYKDDIDSPDLTININSAGIVDAAKTLKGCN